MSGFSAQWLEMREDADARARSRELVHALNHWLHDTAPVNIIDLGCGSGSNLRWLAPRIAAAQRWQLLDNDQQLLSRAALVLAAWAGVRTSSPQGSARNNTANTLCLSERLTVHLARLDLSAQLPPLGDAHLLGASALLDLVSRDWLAGLIHDCARQQIGMLFALNYDGRVRFSPAHADDAMIRDAVNRDQHADKGFGPALGPDCVAALGAECAARRYRVTQWRSDWRLGTDDQTLHTQLVDDFAHIAERILPSRKQHRIRTWQRCRREIVSSSTVRIGHVDMLALPCKSAARRPRQVARVLARVVSPTRATD